MWQWILVRLVQQKKDLLNGTTLDYLLKLEFGNKSNGMSAFMTNF